MKLQIAFTKKGYPAFWEKGGGMTNSGHTELIGDKYGHKKDCIFIRTGGTLSNDNHGLFILNKGDVVCVSHRSGGNISHKLLRYTGEFDKTSQTAEFEMIDFYDSGEWDNDAHTRFNDIVEASKKKVHIYHCRNVVYALGLAPYDDIMYKLDKGVIPEISANFLTMAMLWKLLKVGNHSSDVLKHIKFDNENKIADACIGYLIYEFGFKIASKYMTEDQLNNYYASSKKNTVDTSTPFILAYHKGNHINTEFVTQVGLSGVQVLELPSDDWNEIPEKYKTLKIANKRVYFIDMVNVPKEFYPRNSGYVEFWTSRTLERTEITCYVMELDRAEGIFNDNLYKELREMKE